jgi:hypothetical protein
MKIHCEESATVVENNASSGKKIIANQYNPAVITRHDLGPEWRRQVRAAMRRPWRTVDDPAHAER